MMKNAVIHIFISFMKTWKKWSELDPIFLKQTPPESLIFLVMSYLFFGVKVPLKSRFSNEMQLVEQYYGFSWYFI